MKVNLEVMSSTLVFVLITVVAKMVLKKTRRSRPLAIPGPTPLPLIGNALFLAGNPLKLLDVLTSALDKYNGIFRLWIGPKLMIFISNPEDVEIFCTHPKLLDKSDHYRFVYPLLGNGIFNANGHTWKQGRKLIMPTLRPNAVKQLMPTFNKYAKTMVRVIRKESHGKPFDVFSYVRNCTYDMIFETLLGRECWAQQRNEKALDDTEEVMDLVYQRALKVWLQWDPLFYCLPIGQKFHRLVQKLNLFNSSEIFKSLSLLERGEKGERDLLVEYLSVKLGSDYTAIREHITTMLITGYDTTAGTLGFVLLMLGIHQDVQSKVYDEVRQLKDSLQGEDTETEHLQQLQYLDRVIKETLRLFPVGPLLFRSAAEDLKIGGHTVPKGATVGCVMLKTHRDPANFANPHLFNPDNFLPENVDKRHAYSYIPFSGGPRGCIGTKYGMMSMKIIISELVYNYHITTDITMDGIRLKPEVTMKIVGGYKIAITQRQEHSTV